MKRWTRFFCRSGFLCRQWSHHLTYIQHFEFFFSVIHPVAISSAFVKTRAATHVWVYFNHTEEEEHVYGNCEDRSVVIRSSALPLRSDTVLHYRHQAAAITGDRVAVGIMRTTLKCLSKVKHPQKQFTRNFQQRYSYHPVSLALSIVATKARYPSSRDHSGLNNSYWLHSSEHKMTLTGRWLPQVIIVVTTRLKIPQLPKTVQQIQLGTSVLRA